MSIDLSKLNEERVDSVVFSGVEFVRTLTEAFGAESGKKVWDALSHTVNEDISGRIFLKMYGEGNGSVTAQSFKDYRSAHNTFVEDMRGVGLRVS